jgi:phosphatidylserine decarboxylase
MEYLRVLPQYLLPHHAVSRLTYRITRCEWIPLKNFLIRTFIAVFRVDMSLAKQPDATAHKTFNDFFTRELRPDARPVNQDKNTISCPVDGSISQIGKIESREIFQAKGRTYSLDTLLAGDNCAVNFRDGQFATLYLSPRDYHRIHMPLDGKLTRMIYVPGRLFSVNAHTTRVVQNLFARNERVISIFETEIGPIALVMVGAMNVGSMETVWAGEITPAKNRNLTVTNYKDNQILLKRGEEMGRFNMGSTVILLFPKGKSEWLISLKPNDNIIMGTPLGKITK